jgi:hypothetical protein
MHARKILRLLEVLINRLTIRIEDEHDYILNVTCGNGAYGYFILVSDDNGAFYARKEGYMASQEGIGRIYTCLCHRANGQAVYVDVKLPGTTEGLIQTSVI